MRRFTRMQGRKSLNYSSIITIVVVISACVLGTWITISSLVSSVKNFDKSVKFIKDIKLQNVRKEFSKDLPANASKLNVDNTLQKFEKLGEWDQVEMLEKASADDNNRIDSNKGKEVKFTVDGDAKRLEHDPVTNTGRDEKTPMDQQESEESIAAIKPKKDDGEEKPWVEENSDSTKEEIDNIKVEVNIQKLEQFSVSLEQNKDAGEKTTDSWSKDQSKLLNGTFDQIVVQAAESEKQKVAEEFSLLKDQKGFIWKLCNVTAGPDYIPCLDNIQAIRKLPNISHYEHRERHCPDEAPTCLVPLPEGYRTSVQWPKSREKIWFANVPHMKLIEFKGHQNWVQVSGSYITFPGGGTQFKHGAMHYIDFIQKTVPDISWGKRSRIVLDVGCGVASFGGYLFDREVLTMSLAPKDKHEAQVQFALERGIPAISGVMGTQRLPFPIMAFDVVHCARCRVPWHIEGGKLLLELDRVLRPGGYFVWSATPIYRKDPEDVSIWKAMSKLTKSMCWELLRTGNDKLNGVSVAIYRKPTSNVCYESRTKNDPPLCQESDEPSAVWNVPLEACIHKVPKNPSVRGYQLPAKWPSRLEKPPYWLKDSETGDYGKAAPKDFMDDYEHWKRVFVRSYSNGIGIDWSSVRNVMDMKAMYGGFAAALKDLKLWVMNVVPITSPDTLSIIYERGLFGIYHDWCESFSTYPRSYDLLHADHLFSDLKKRCKFVAVIAEVDRILRPGGSLIVKDDVETITEVENLAKSLKWKMNFIFSNDNEGVLCVQKTRWRPSDAVTIISAVA